jgi:hypothetical protein
MIAQLFPAEEVATLFDDRSVTASRSDPHQEKCIDIANRRYNSYSHMLCLLGYFQQDYFANIA